MIYQLRANGNASYDGFGAYIRSRKIPVPTPKKVLESVPYRNGSYDFSLLAGELAFEDLIISYSFDVADFAVPIVQSEKDALATWLIGVQDMDITDDYVSEARPGAVWHGSFEGIDWDEEGGQGLMEVSFRVWPYKLLPQQTITLSAGTANFTNPSVHRVVPVLNKDSGVGNITTPKGTFSAPSGQDVKNTGFELLPGANTWTIAGSGNVRLTFRPEVF
jgi:hypothetical protein